MKTGERVLAEFLKTHIADGAKLLPESIKRSVERNAEAAMDELLGIFAALCDLALRMQEKRLLGDVSMINFSFLRIGLADGRGLYRLDIRDENWLAAKAPPFALWDTKFAFDPYFEAVRDWKGKANRFGYGLREIDVEERTTKLAALPRLAADAFIANAAPALGGHPSYAALAKTKDCAITVGEYRDSQTLVYPV